MVSLFSLRVIFPRDGASILRLSGRCLKRYHPSHDSLWAVQAGGGGDRGEGSRKGGKDRRGRMREARRVGVIDGGRVGMQERRYEGRLKHWLETGGVMWKKQLGRQAERVDTKEDFRGTGIMHLLHIPVLCATLT